MKYKKGMHEVANGVWAYLQPDGGWGWSNAGLITDGDRSLLVDTLFDLKLTAEMLAAMRRTTSAAKRIDTLVNTHANGDHWYGNSLVDGAEIFASASAAAEMLELPPARFAQLMKAAPNMGEAGAFLARMFGPFDFEGIDAALPTRTFTGGLDLGVGNRRVRLLEVGPAHTAGDVIVHLPDEGVVFTGDILFHGGHPIVWAGPISNWIAACDRILALEPVIVVPGHGPLAGPAAVADLKGYFEYLSVEARRRFDTGMSAAEASRDIDLGPYSGWSEDERVVVNVGCLYREFGAETPSDVGNLMDQMAVWAGER
jgi:glyoxylase-like metal-dependent hydrolase (beta-lactamase superfamily II)